MIHTRRRFRMGRTPCINYMAFRSVRLHRIRGSRAHATTRPTIQHLSRHVEHLRRTFSCSAGRSLSATVFSVSSTLVTRTENTIAPGRLSCLERNRNSPGPKRRVLCCWCGTNSRRATLAIINSEQCRNSLSAMVSARFIP